MKHLEECNSLLNRRRFIGNCATGLGAAALTQLDAAAAVRDFAPQAKRVIYLFQSGAPSQLETFDYKPGLQKLHKTELPDSVRNGQRVTGMTSSQKSFPIAASKFNFQQHGRSGTWLSELLPHHGEIVDDICLVRSMYTEAINHDPAITLMQTGTQQPGRPSFGAWASYGLGSENKELPAFVVMISKGSGLPNAQGLLGRLWGNGFLPSKHQGVKLRSTGDPVLYLANPDGLTREMRRDMLDGIGSLNRLLYDELGDPETNARIAQYEMAFRMQSSVPELTDISKEPKHVLDMYGKDVIRPGSYAANCLLARRLAERDVPFIQLYHRGWDQHGNLPNHISKQCQDVDQASAALIKDLKQRGMLDDTLVVWSGEFGRSVYCQGNLTADNYGRDHHPRCFSAWLAGGGIRPGMVYGESDDFSYNIARDGVHVHDLQATMLHCMGIDHKRLTFKHQGRYYRLTDVHGKVVRPILA
ncbi:MAG: hypothetical protein ACI9HK_000577 [Pirellulaceae bacterium]|jgi:hypothetical protein